MNATGREIIESHGPTRWVSVLDRRRRAASWHIRRRVSILDRIDMVRKAGPNLVLGSVNRPAGESLVIYIGMPAPPPAPLVHDPDAGLIAYLRAWFRDPLTPELARAEWRKALRFGRLAVEAVADLEGVCRRLGVEPGRHDASDGLLAFVRRYFEDPLTPPDARAEFQKALASGLRAVVAVAKVTRAGTCDDHFVEVNKMVAAPTDEECQCRLCRKRRVEGGDR